MLDTISDLDFGPNTVTTLVITNFFDTRQERILYTHVHGIKNLVDDSECT